MMVGVDFKEFGKELQQLVGKRRVVAVIDRKVEELGDR